MLCFLQTFKMLQHWVDTITIEDINKEAASLLSFASHYGTEGELLEEAAQEPERFAPPGPTRTTAIVACFPAFTDPHGESIGQLLKLPDYSDEIEVAAAAASTS